MRDIVDLMHALMFEVWAMSASQAHAMINTIYPKIIANDWSIFDERPKQNYFTGEPLEQVTYNGDCAVIPVKGRIMKDVPTFFKSIFSLADVRDVQDELSQCLNNADVGRVAMDMDTPGGLAAASDELAGDVEAFAKHKPVMTYIRNQGLSAGYEIAAPSQMILCNENALVGSIGSLLIISDTTGLAEKMGIKTEIFASGKYKGIGHGPITDEQRAFLNEMTTAYADRFKGFVTRNRPGVKAEDMEGQWFRGDKAAERGLVAGTAKNLNSAIDRFRKLV